jgi:hypothetical protein
MIPYFKALGESIERSWLRCNYDEEAFSQLVLDELRRNPPIEHVKVEEIINWIFSPAHDFIQPSPREFFGEPPVMLFQAPRFYIEALFWLSATTSIHEHKFSGAFAVLAGGSVHSHWRFTPERTVNSRMLCGRLERVSTEILRPGGMMPIYSGSRLIHQLFHLEVPSVTIVVRSYVERNRLPQYDYLLPGLALDTDDHDPLRTRRLMFLEGMARGQVDGLRKHACHLAENGELETIYYMFSALTRRKIDATLLEELYDKARERHGDVIDLFRRVCAAERRTRLISSLRSRISNPEARFLLALLMLMPDRDSIFATIQLQFPEIEPLAAVEAWLASMSGKETIGFELNDENRMIFRALVEGLDADGLLQRLRTGLKEESVDANRDRLLDHAKRLARSDLFYPLLSNSPLRGEALAV